MTKDVLISISGLQHDMDEESIEVITVGNYYFRNEKHYIFYEETFQDVTEMTSNTIKISKNKIDIIKKGISNVHMVFDVSKKNVTYYNTQYGELQIGINTSNIDVLQESDCINVKIKYSLEINYAHASECHIEICVRNLNGDKLEIQEGLCSKIEYNKN